VVDFSALWAGPLCAHLLGLGGADVIKVETPTRPDGARAGDPDFYRLLHAGHRSVVLDPDLPRDRAALAALVAGADVVLEASRPRALAGWGLDPGGTAATWVSITAAGRASDRVGFGDDVTAGAGLVALDAAGPVFAGDALADPLSGLTAAVRVLTSPPGSLLDVAMAAVVAATLDGTGTEVAPDADPPRARILSGPAPAAGADTAAVLREL
jgi:crotonobetainyl-CoA:carnitine CoA-transferase CaiB-like acyl-CoA transferase